MCTLVPPYSLYYPSQMRTWRAKCAIRAPRWSWTGRWGKDWSLTEEERSSWRRNNPSYRNPIFQPLMPVSSIKTQHRHCRHHQLLLEYYPGGLGQRAVLQRGGETRLHLRLVHEGLGTIVGEAESRPYKCRLFYLFENLLSKRSNTNEIHHCILIIIVYTLSSCLTICILTRKHHKSITGIIFLYRVLDSAK